MNPLTDLQKGSPTRLRKKKHELLETKAKANITNEGTIDSVFGIWKDKAISLTEIREEQWVRKIK